MNKDLYNSLANSYNDRNPDAFTKALDSHKFDDDTYNSLATSFNNEDFDSFNGVLNGYYDQANSKANPEAPKEVAKVKDENPKQSAYSKEQMTLPPDQQRWTNEDGAPVNGYGKLIENEPKTIDYAKQRSELFQDFDSYIDSIHSQTEIVSDSKENFREYTKQIESQVTKMSQMGLSSWEIEAFVKAQTEQAAKRFPLAAKDTQARQKQIDDNIYWNSMSDSDKFAPRRATGKANAKKALKDLEEEYSYKFEEAANDPDLLDQYREEYAEKSIAEQRVIDEGLGDITYGEIWDSGSDYINSGARALTSLAVDGYNKAKEFVTAIEPQDPRETELYKSFESNPKAQANMMRFYNEKMKDYDPEGRTGMFTPEGVLGHIDMLKSGYGADVIKKGEILPDGSVASEDTELDLGDHGEMIAEALYTDPVGTLASIGLESLIDPQMVVGVMGGLTSKITGLGSMDRARRVLYVAIRRNIVDPKNLAKLAKSPKIAAILANSGKLAKNKFPKLSSKAVAMNKAITRFSTGANATSKVGRLKSKLAKAQKFGKGSHVVGLAKSTAKEGLTAGTLAIMHNEALGIKKDWVNTFIVEGVEEGAFDFAMNLPSSVKGILKNRKYKHYLETYEKHKKNVNKFNDHVTKFQEKETHFDKEEELDDFIEVTNQIGDVLVEDSQKMLVNLIRDYKIHKSAKNASTVDTDLNEYTASEQGGQWLELGKKEARGMYNLLKQKGHDITGEAIQRYKSNAKKGRVFLSEKAIDDIEVFSYLQRINPSAAKRAKAQIVKQTMQGIDSVVDGDKIRTDYNEDIISKNWERILDSDDPLALASAHLMFENVNYAPDSFNKHLQNLSKSAQGIQSADIANLRNSILSVRNKENLKGLEKKRAQVKDFAHFLKDYSYAQRILTDENIKESSDSGSTPDSIFYSNHKGGAISHDFADVKAFHMAAEKSGFQIPKNGLHAHVTKHPGLAKQEFEVTNTRNQINSLSHYVEAIKKNNPEMAIKIENSIGQFENIYDDYMGFVSEGDNLYNKFLATEDPELRKAIKEDILNLETAFLQTMSDHITTVQNAYEAMAPDPITNTDDLNKIKSMELNDEQKGLNSFIGIYNKLAPLGLNLSVKSIDNNTILNMQENPDGSIRVELNNKMNQTIYHVSNNAQTIIADKMDQLDINDEFEYLSDNEDGTKSKKLNLAQLNAALLLNNQAIFNQVKRAFNLKGQGPVEVDIIDSFKLARQTYLYNDSEGHANAMRKLNGQLQSYHAINQTNESASADRFTRRAAQAFVEYQKALKGGGLINPEIVYTEDPEISGKLIRPSEENGLKDNKILINKDILEQLYKDKAWRNPRALEYFMEDESGEPILKVDYSRPLLDEYFPTYEAFENFVVQHEYSHSMYPREEFFDEFGVQHIAKYEDEVNKRALQSIKDGFVYNKSSGDNIDLSPEGVLEKHRGFIFLDDNNMPQMVDPYVVKKDGNTTAGRSFRAFLSEEISKGDVSPLATSGAEMLLPFYLNIKGLHYNEELIRKIASESPFIRFDGLSDMRGSNAVWFSIADMKNGSDPQVRLRQSKAETRHSKEGYEQHLMPLMDFISYLNNPLSKPNNLKLDLSGTHHSPVVQAKDPNLNSLRAEGQISNIDYNNIEASIQQGANLTKPKSVEVLSIPIGGPVYIKDHNDKNRLYTHELIQVGGNPYSALINKDIVDKPITIPVSHLETLFVEDNLSNSALISRSNTYKTELQRKADPTTTENIERAVNDEEESLKEFLEVQKASDEVDKLTPEQYDENLEKQYYENLEIKAAEEERERLLQEKLDKERDIEHEEDMLPFKLKTQRMVLVHGGSVKQNLENTIDINEDGGMALEDLYPANKLPDGFKFLPEDVGLSISQSKAKAMLESENLSTDDLIALSNYRTNNDLSLEGVSIVGDIINTIGENTGIGSVANFNPGSGALFRSFNVPVESFHQFDVLTKNSYTSDFRSKINNALHGRDTEMHLVQDQSIVPSGFNVSLLVHGPNETQQRSHQERYEPKITEDQIRLEFEANFDQIYTDYVTEFESETGNANQSPMSPESFQENGYNIFFEQRIKEHSDAASRKVPSIKNRTSFNFKRAFDATVEGGFVVSVLPTSAFLDLKGDLNRTYVGLMNQGDMILTKNIGQMYEGGESGVLIVARKNTKKDQNQNVPFPHIEGMESDFISPANRFLSSLTLNNTKNILKVASGNSGKSAHQINYNIKSVAPDISVRAKGDHYIPPKTGIKSRMEQIEGEEMLFIASNVIKSANTRGQSNPVVQINLDANTKNTTVRTTSIPWPAGWGVNIDNTFHKNLTAINSKTGKHIDKNDLPKIAEFINKDGKRMPSPNEIDLGTGEYNHVFSPVVLFDDAGRISNVFIGERVSKGSYHKVLAKSFENQFPDLNVVLITGSSESNVKKIDAVKAAAAAGSVNVIITDSNNEVPITNYNGGTRISNKLHDKNNSKNNEALGVITVHSDSDADLQEEIAERESKIKNYAKDMASIERSMLSGSEKASKLPGMLTQLMNASYNKEMSNFLLDLLNSGKYDNNSEIELDDSQKVKDSDVARLMAESTHYKDVFTDMFHMDMDKLDILKLELDSVVDQLSKQGESNPEGVTPDFQKNVQKAKTSLQYVSMMIKSRMIIENSSYDSLDLQEKYTEDFKGYTREIASHALDNLLSNYSVYEIEPTKGQWAWAKQLQGAYPALSTYKIARTFALLSHSAKSNPKSIFSNSFKGPKHPRFGNASQMSVKVFQALIDELHAEVSSGLMSKGITRSSSLPPGEMALELGLNVTSREAFLQRLKSRADLRNKKSEMELREETQGYVESAYFQESEASRAAKLHEEAQINRQLLTDGEQTYDGLEETADDAALEEYDRQMEKAVAKMHQLQAEMAAIRLIVKDNRVSEQKKNEAKKLYVEKAAEIQGIESDIMSESILEDTDYTLDASKLTKSFMDPTQHLDAIVEREFKKQEVKSSRQGLMNQIKENLDAVKNSGSQKSIIEQEAEAIQAYESMNDSQDGFSNVDTMLALLGVSSAATMAISGFGTPTDENDKAFNIGVVGAGLVLGSFGLRGAIRSYAKTKDFKNTEVFLDKRQMDQFIDDNDQPASISEVEDKALGMLHDSTKGLFRTQDNVWDQYASKTGHGSFQLPRRLKNLSVAKQQFYGTILGDLELKARSMRRDDVSKLNEMFNNRSLVKVALSNDFNRYLNDKISFDEMTTGMSEELIDLLSDDSNVKLLETIGEMKSIELQLNQIAKVSDIRRPVILTNKTTNYDALIDEMGLNTFSSNSKRNHDSGRFNALLERAANSLYNDKVENLSDSQKERIGRELYEAAIASGKQGKSDLAKVLERSTKYLFPNGGEAASVFQDSAKRRVDFLFESESSQATRIYKKGVDWGPDFEEISLDHFMANARMSLNGILNQKYFGENLQDLKQHISDVHNGMKTNDKPFEGFGLDLINDLAKELSTTKNELLGLGQVRSGDPASKVLLDNFVNKANAMQHMNKIMMSFKAGPINGAMAFASTAMNSGGLWDGKRGNPITSSVVTAAWDMLRNRSKFTDLDKAIVLQMVEDANIDENSLNKSTLQAFYKYAETNFGDVWDMANSQAGLGKKLYELSKMGSGGIAGLPWKIYKGINKEAYRYGFMVGKRMLGKQLDNIRTVESAKNSVGSIKMLQSVFSDAEIKEMLNSAPSDTQKNRFGIALAHKVNGTSIRKWDLPGAANTPEGKAALLFRKSLMRMYGMMVESYVDPWADPNVSMPEKLRSLGKFASSVSAGAGISVGIGGVMSALGQSDWQEDNLSEEMDGVGRWVSYVLANFYMPSGLSLAMDALTTPGDEYLAMMAKTAGGAWTTTIENLAKNVTDIPTFLRKENQLLNQSYKFSSRDYELPALNKVLKDEDVSLEDLIPEAYINTKKRFDPLSNMMSLKSPSDWFSTDPLVPGDNKNPIRAQVPFFNPIPEKMKRTSTHNDLIKTKLKEFIAKGLSGGQMNISELDELFKLADGKFKGDFINTLRTSFKKAKTDQLKKDMAEVVKRLTRGYEGYLDLKGKNPQEILDQIDKSQIKKGVEDIEIDPLSDNPIDDYIDSQLR